MHRILTLLVIAAAAAACHSSPSAPPPVEPLESHACPETRPQMCTKEYRPVCATRDTGIRCVTTPCNSTEERTYGNACTACAHADVLRYTAGACEDRGRSEDDALRDRIR